MSWEFARCPVCGGLMERVGADKDETGRIVMSFACRIDDETADLPEPDDNYQSRMELAAKDAAR